MIPNPTVAAPPIESRFGIIGGDEHATHGELALALATEFGRVDLAAFESAISGIARRLGIAREFEPARQLHHVSDVLSATLQVGSHEPPTLDDLLYDRILASGRGHELACILVAIEAGRRAGIELGLVASVRYMLLAVPAIHAPYVLAPRRQWRIIDARELNDTALSWMCPHESAAIWLAIVRGAAIARGASDVALRALDLHLALPLHGPEQRRLQEIRARISAPSV